MSHLNYTSACDLRRAPRRRGTPRNPAGRGRIIPAGLAALLSLGALRLYALDPLPAPAPLTRDGLAPPDARVTAALPRYLESRAAGFVDWLSDGSMLIATRFGETEQIHRLRAPLGMREQLSFEPHGVRYASARPYQSDAFLVLEPNHGDESSQLWLQSLSDHALTALTDGASRDETPHWAHDGKRIAFASNRRNGVDYDIYVLDTGTVGVAPRLVVGGDGNHWQVLDWSLDDRRLLLGRQPSAERASAADAALETEIYLADIESGEVTALRVADTVLDPKSGHKPSDHKPSDKSAAAALRARAARFAPDGRGILVLSAPTASAGAGADYAHLHYADPVTGEWHALGPDTAHDVELFDESSDARYLAYVQNDNGFSQLVLLDQQRKLEFSVTQLPPGVISALKFDASGKRLALSYESARSPRDVYVFEPETQALTRWTQSEVGPLDAQAFAIPTLLRFPTWDRVDGQARELAAFVYRTAAPAAAVPNAAGPRPVLILLRSGGESQFRPGFDPFVQFLVQELGFVVLAPEVRGSTGYGRAFAALAQGELRDDAERDIGSLLVWIGLQHELDRNRVVVMGEGYGGYLALASLARYTDRLCGGIAAFPPQLLPLANVAAIRRPVLLVQGLSNPAVPAYQAEQLRSRLRVNGVDAQYLAAADEGHDFSRKSNLDAYRSAAANFLAQLLR